MKRRVVNVGMVHNAELDYLVSVSRIAGGISEAMLNFAMQKAGAHTRFKGRVIGVCKEDVAGNRCVLAHTTDPDEYWALPGGTIEALEPSATTLKREMIEELGVEVEIGRLIWIVENFFDIEGSDFHEIAFYYEMRLPAECHLLSSTRPFTSQDGETELTFAWHSVDDVRQLHLKPEFLQTGLQETPSTTQHLVVDELSNLTTGADS